MEHTLRQLVYHKPNYQICIYQQTEQRIEHALQKEGFQSVKFYNPNGALGYHPDDSYFAGKDITVARLKNWQLEDISKIDVSDAVSQSKQVGFDRIQMVQDDNKRWAMYINQARRTEGFFHLSRQGGLEPLLHHIETGAGHDGQFESGTGTEILCDGRDKA